MQPLSGLKIALVFPPYRMTDDPAFLNETRRYLGVVPPLSLAYVAAILEQAGCMVSLIDAAALNLDRAQVLERLRKFSPEFLGFTSSTIDFHNTLEWVDYLKKETSLPVIIGGVHMSVYPLETMTHCSIDYGIIGEAEETLPQALECLVNRGDLDKVQGVCHRKNSRIVINGRRAPIKNLDDYPFPARHLLNNERYFSLISRKKNFTAMITSRGCPYQCIFCDNRTIMYRCRSPENIVDEMEQCKKRLNINEIDIYDALFSVDQRRVVEVCRQIKQRRLEIDWTFRTRVDLVDGTMLDELKQAGCIRIYYGIESGDETVLEQINKKVTMETIKRAITLTKDKGIDTFGYFMVGNIGETKETVKKTLDLMLELPLDHVQISPVFTPPNTALYEMLKSQIKTDYWRDYVLGFIKQDPLPRYGTKLTDRQIKRHVRGCYLRFYLRASYIIKTISRIKTYDEFIRFVKATAGMMFYYCFG